MWRSDGGGIGPYYAVPEGDPSIASWPEVAASFYLIDISGLWELYEDLFYYYKWDTSQVDEIDLPDLIKLHKQLQKRIKAQREERVEMLKALFGG